MLLVSEQGQGEGKERESGIGLGGRSGERAAYRSAVGDKMQELISE